MSANFLLRCLQKAHKIQATPPSFSKGTTDLLASKSFFPGSYIPHFVQSHIKDLNTIQTAKWDSTTVHVYSAKGFKRFKSYIADIQLAENFLKCLGIVPRQVVIHILYIPGYPKTIKCENCILSSNEVNSGFYTMGTIWIYRSQELLKTTIHELTHAYGVDTERFHSIERRYLPKLLNVQMGKNHPNGEVCLTEGVVDFIACLTMACIRTKLPLTKESLEHNLKLQATHIASQAKKILCVLKKNNTIENTHTYAYYVVKGILFGALTESLKYFQNNGWYVNSHETLERFLEFLISKNHYDLPQSTCVIGSKSLRMNAFD